jgi:NADH:ubiquinone reductase (H+-translocating)
MSEAVRRVMVVGGGYAGVMAANRARNLVRSGDRVTLISDREDMVDRVRLHEVLAGAVRPLLPLHSLVAREVEVVHNRVVSIDAERRRVVTHDRITRDADVLILAPGSVLSTNVDGAGEHASWLASPERATHASEILRGLSEGESVVVVGGSLTGLEVACEIAEKHPKVSVILVAPTLSPTLSSQGTTYVRATLDALGIGLRENVKVHNITSKTVELSTGEILASSLTIWSGGFVSAGSTVSSNLACDDMGRWRINADLGALHTEGVYIAGDVAAPPPGMPWMRMGCASAMPMGAQAAVNSVRWLNGQPTEPHRFGFFAQCISLGRKRGLVQSVEPNDMPAQRVITGKAGAVIKESICRFVIGMIRAERMVSGAYHWPRTLRANSLGV